jgi:hypothetical protein
MCSVVEDELEEGPDVDEPESTTIAGTKEPSKRSISGRVHRDVDRVEQPSTTTVKQHAPGGRNQDYLALARLYKIQRPYSDPNYKALCLLCSKEFCDDAFFPCEHHCVLMAMHNVRSALVSSRG